MEAQMRHLRFTSASIASLAIVSTLLATSVEEAAYAQKKPVIVCTSMSLTGTVGGSFKGSLARCSGNTGGSGSVLWFLSSTGLYLNITWANSRTTEIVLHEKFLKKVTGCPSGSTKSRVTGSVISD